MISPEDRLRSMVEADRDPELSNAEIQMLLEDYSIPSEWSTWAASTAYVVGQRVVPYPGNNNVYIVTVAGTSGATQPVFPTVPLSTITDGGVTWRQDSLTRSYDFNRAAAQGWRLKMGKVANRYDVDMDLHQRLERSDLIKHMEMMVKQYSRRAMSSVLVGTGYVEETDIIGNVNAG